MTITPGACTRATICARGDIYVQGVGMGRVAASSELARMEVSRTVHTRDTRLMLTCDECVSPGSQLSQSRVLSG